MNTATRFAHILRATAALLVTAVGILFSADDSEPQEIGLFLVAALDKEFNLIPAQRPKPRDDLPADSFERTECSCLQHIFCDDFVSNRVPIAKIKI
jgi:hypothetical protein